MSAHRPLASLCSPRLCDLANTHPWGFEGGKARLLHVQPSSYGGVLL